MVNKTTKQGLMILGVVVVLGLVVGLFGLFSQSLFTTTQSCQTWFSQEQSAGSIDAGVASFDAVPYDWDKSGSSQTRCVTVIQPKAGPGSTSLNQCELVYEFGDCTTVSLGGEQTNQPDTSDLLPFGQISADASCSVITNVDTRNGKSDDPTHYNGAGAWISVDANQDGTIESYGFYEKKDDALVNLCHVAWNTGITTPEGYRIDYRDTGIYGEEIRVLSDDCHYYVSFRTTRQVTALAETECPVDPVDPVTGQAPPVDTNDDPDANVITDTADVVDNGVDQLSSSTGVNKTLIYVILVLIAIALIMASSNGKKNR